MNNVKKRYVVSENGYIRYSIENGNSFICDSCFLPLLLKHNWLIDKYGYPVTKINKQTVRFSRIIVNPPDGAIVDHINGNPQDNRLSNLRIVTEIDNQRNMRLPSHNTSGFKGVSFRKDRGKYRAYISIHNKTKHLGSFESAENAARAYDDAARFYFGEYASLNFPARDEQSCFRNIHDERKML